MQGRPHLELVTGGKTAERPALGPALELMALGTGLTLAASVARPLAVLACGARHLPGADGGGVRLLLPRGVARGWHAAHSAARHADRADGRARGPRRGPARDADALGRRVSLPLGRPRGGGRREPLPGRRRCHRASRDSATTWCIRASTIPSSRPSAQPLALAGFAMVALVSPTVWAMKLGCCFTISRSARCSSRGGATRRGRNRGDRVRLESARDRGVRRLGSPRSDLTAVAGGGPRDRGGSPRALRARPGGRRADSGWRRSWRCRFCGARGHGGRA